YQYNSQAPQLIRLIDESLIQHGAQRNFNLVSTSNGIQAAQVLLSHHGRLISMCQEQPHWQDICRGIGQTMMSQGLEAMDVLMGRQLLGELSPDTEVPPWPDEWEAFYKS